MSSETNHLNFIAIISEWNEKEENPSSNFLNTEDSNTIHLKPPEKNSRMTKNDSRKSTSSKNSIEVFLRDFVPSNQADFTTTTFKDAFHDIFKPLNKQEKDLNSIEKMRKILHSQFLYVAQIILVILDIICVLLQIVCEIILKDDGYTENIHNVILKNGTSINVDIAGFSHDFEKFHNNRYAHYTQLFESIVEILSAFILSVVILIALLKLIFEFKSFIKSRLEIFDVTIVVISFFLELFVIIKKHSIKEIEAAAVIFRFWRIIRIMNG